MTPQVQRKGRDATSKLASWRPCKASEDSTATAVISAPGNETCQASRLESKWCPVFSFPFFDEISRLNLESKTRNGASKNCQTTTMNYDELWWTMNNWIVIKAKYWKSWQKHEGKNGHSESQRAIQAKRPTPELVEHENLPMKHKFRNAQIIVSNNWPGSDGDSPELWLHH